jgi:hypothetical protein
MPVQGRAGTLITVRRSRIKAAGSGMGLGVVELIWLRWSGAKTRQTDSHSSKRQVRMFPYRRTSDDECQMNLVTVGHL